MATLILGLVSKATAEQTAYGMTTEPNPQPTAVDE
jgi:hypothetical protein